jgi:16S rRNA processing protein RimM
MNHDSVTDYINVARISRTHGKKGEVVAVPLDGLPFCLKTGMRVCLTPPEVDMERFCTVTSVGTGEPPLVGFSCSRDLNAAERLVGKLVLARREDVPEYVEEQGFLDCVGCDMVDVELGVVGTITELMMLPANDVWTVHSEKYGEFLVPVLEDVVLELPEDEDGAVTVRLPRGILPEV